MHTSDLHGYPCSSPPPSSPVPPSSSSNIKKRRLEQLEHEISCYSDLPAFSSDPPDSDVALDLDRRKRVYRGAWWGDVKQEYSRNFDSGVFIPSDDSLANPTQDQTTVRMVPLRNLDQLMLNTSKPVDHARAIIENALETGNDIVDMADLGLLHLDEEIPEALQSLIKTPRFYDGSESPHEQDYQSLEPRIQMFLANNSLATLPPSLWNLQNLTVLSVRNNALTSIPASIARLTNLVELNLANNHLRWLPYQLLSLLGPGKPLTKIHFRPNPFFTGVKGDWPFTSGNFAMPHTSAALEDKMTQLAQATDINTSNLLPNHNNKPERWLHKLLSRLSSHLTDSSINLGPGPIQPSYLWEDPARFAFTALHIATTPVWLFATDGSVQQQAQSFAPSRAPLHQTYLLADPYPQPVPIKKQSRVPSLLELAMNQCAVSPDLYHLEDMLGPYCPVPVLRALEETKKSVEEGLRLCTVCARRYHVPRCEWIEYWHVVPENASMISSDEMFWPFLRRGCSWACVA